MKKLLPIFLLLPCLSSYGQNDIYTSEILAFNHSAYPAWNTDNLLPAAEPQRCRNGLTVIGTVIAVGSGVAMAYTLAPVLFDHGANNGLLIGSAVGASTGLAFIIIGKNACKRKAAPETTSMQRKNDLQLNLVASGRTIGLELRF